MDRAVISSLAFPFAGALLVILLGERHCRAAAVAMATAAFASAMTLVSFTGGEELQHTWGALAWLGLKDAAVFGYLVDPLTRIMLLVVTGIGFLVALYSTGYMSPGNADHPVHEGQPRFYFWLLAFEGSMVGVVISPNLLQMFIFWELTTLCSWALISYYQTKESTQAGFKALVMTHIGGFGFLLALALLFAHTSRVGFPALATLPASVKTACFMLLLVAAWAKAAQVPFHTWLPSAMAAPTPISAYLHAAAMVKAGVFLMARLVYSSAPTPYAASVTMLSLAVLTMMVAVFFMVLQDDLKRLLAFSTIAHLGLVLVGVALGALGSSTGYRGGVLHILMHSVAKTTLFLTVGAIAYTTGSRKLSELTGAGRGLPVVATAFFTGALAAAGVPPLACFWSKFYILGGALGLGGVAGVMVLAFVLLESVVVLGWLVYVGHRVFLTRAPEEKAIGSAPLVISIVLIVLTALCVLIPMLGMWMVEEFPA